MLDRIHYWDSFLSENDLPKVWDEIEKSNWEFKAGEHADPSIKEPLRTFWYKELKQSEFIESLFKNKIEEYMGKKIESQRLYLNGQAHSQTAWVHTDVPNVMEGEYGSVVYYIHSDWRPVYGGHLIFLDDSETEVTNSFFPKYNSALMFNSKMKHCALEPTVYCRTQRLSIAYKFKVIG
jgi:hypothetical protein